MNLLLSFVRNGIMNFPLAFIRNKVMNLPTTFAGNRITNLPRHSREYRITDLSRHSRENGNPVVEYGLLIFSVFTESSSLFLLFPPSVTIAQEFNHWCRVAHGLDPRLRGDDDWIENPGVTTVEAEL